MFNLSSEYKIKRSDYINYSDEFKKHYLEELINLKKENEYLQELIFKMYGKKNDAYNTSGHNMSTSNDVIMLNKRILGKINELLDAINKL